MSGEVLIRAKGVSKKFSSRLKTSMKYGVIDIARDFIGLPTHSDTLRPKEFWSVQDVSFEIRRGECLGLIGPNGAGKSTLLKMLNGIIMPDKGSIEINGRVGALIEVGAGFHPLLTGRENIYINGSIMGLRKKEIDERFDSIVEFAELGDFIDMPVSYYSSGMYVRLGFAIAAHLEPDILLIDEVLAVGDVGFRAKCFNAIYSIMQNSAVILVTHSMPQVSRICSDIMVMNKGESKFQGKDVPKGIGLFYSFFEEEKSMVIGGKKAKILEVELESKGVRGIEKINYLDELTVHLRIQIDSDIEHPNILVNIFSQELQIITLCSSYFNQVEIYNSGEEIYAILNMGKINLNPGLYLMEVAITAEKHRNVLVKHQAVKRLVITGNYVGFAPVLIPGEWRINNS